VKPFFIVEIISSYCAVVSAAVFLFILASYKSSYNRGGKFALSPRLSLDGGTVGF
jgi:hypothetical protein